MCISCKYIIIVVAPENQNEMIIFEAFHYDFIKHKDSRLLE